MKIIWSVCMLAVLLFSRTEALAQTVGTDIPAEDITDFYYTYSRIGFNAEYLRYRFYVEEGKYFFFYETRGTRDDYGWNTEEDILSGGTRELSGEEWAQFAALLKDGSVKNRSESVESGDSGPWMYLYWTGDKGTNQEYTFASYAAESAFVEYCEGLAADPMSTAALIFCEYSIYGGMENEDTTYTVSNGGPGQDDILLIEKKGRTEKYALPANTLEDLAGFVAGYHPEKWADLPDAEEYALDAPSERIVLTYEDGKQYSVEDGKELGGGLFQKLGLFLRSYLAEDAGTFEISLVSSDGGGPVLRPVLTAPEMIRIEERFEDEKDRDEAAAGTGSAVTLVFHGRIPGRTELTFEENDARTSGEEIPKTVRVLEVDRDYNVTVVETREE